MAKRKRTSRRTGLVGRAVSAGRRALKEAESRVPPDLRRQVERRLKEADKNARTAIKVLQTQVKRASTRADVNAVLKRIDGLARGSGLLSRTDTSPRSHHDPTGCQPDQEGDGNCAKEGGHARIHHPDPPHGHPAQLVKSRRFWPGIDSAAPGAGAANASGRNEHAAGARNAGVRS